MRWGFWAGNWIFVVYNRNLLKIYKKRLQNDITMFPLYIWFVAQINCLVCVCHSGVFYFTLNPLNTLILWFYCWFWASFSGWVCCVLFWKKNRSLGIGVVIEVAGISIRKCKECDIQISISESIQEFFEINLRQVPYSPFEL